MARRRAQWTKYRERIDPSRLVFIDETWTKTNMAPLRGWAPRGQRIKAKVPHGRWQTMTFLAALRHDRITAPWRRICRTDEQKILTCSNMRFGLYVFQLTNPAPTVPRTTEAVYSLSSGCSDAFSA